MIDRDTRRAYFEDYGDTIEELPPSLVQYGVRFPCAHCGYPTLKTRDEPCALCANDTAATREIAAAFDAMPTTPMAEHEPLWAAVVRGMGKF
ncbi:MAG TPA: hypothetical protein VGD79_12690 [Thermoanaerobaculia bacterium]